MSRPTRRGLLPSRESPLGPVVRVVVVAVVAVALFTVGLAVVVVITAG